MKLMAPFALLGLLCACSDPELHTDIGLKRGETTIYPAATARMGILTFTVKP
ncbi:hypothetical protein [Thioclava atlantica]|uniref:hypothetical protein n=1 Tax=Thioclava atlantica TaxID=1317124 RepID=UPI000AE3159D|nr:hypothetical protein [Thioclava atlantica]